MTFNRQFLAIAFRIAVITALALGLSYSVLRTDLLVTPLMFGLLLMLVSTELVWTLQRQERGWVRFLESVKYQDFNRVYQKQSSKELTKAYELITQSMEELQSNQEAEFRLLQTVLGHLSVGIACYTEAGDVRFTNSAFDDLLGLKALIHVDRLRAAHPEVHQVMMASDSVPMEWLDHTSGKKLFIRTEHFKLRGKAFKLVSLTDIRSSLDAKEMESYQKLMRVMTHEIMNSATPILSLIRVVNKKLIHEDAFNILSKKDEKNIAKSLYAVEERTAGILKFVDAYKEINRPIVPALQVVKSHELLSEVKALMNPSLKDLKFTVTHGLNDTLIIDRMLMSQVLINLVKNAHEAIDDVPQGEVQIILSRTEEATHLSVSDNGGGVRSEDLPQLFVPFFTTKPEGSGVGLALSRKIVKAHGGTLEYIALPKGSQFQIALPVS